MKKRLVIGSALLAMLSASVSPLAAEVDSSSYPGQCWWPQLELVLAAATDSRGPAGDFTSAVGFLELNTGIDSGLVLSFVGYTGKPRQVQRAYKAWSAWFTANYPYLYWDPARHVFLVDAKAKSERQSTSRVRGPVDGECYPPLPTCEEILGQNAELCRFFKNAE